MITFDKFVTGKNNFRAELKKTKYPEKQIMNESIEIPLSKNKLTLLLIGALAFVSTGIVFIVNPPVLSNPVFGNPLLILVTGIACAVFFGICSILIIKKIADKTPGIIVNADGITDNSSGISAGLIPWEDVREIRRTSIANQHLIMIIVNNPQEYINRQTNFIKKKAMQINFTSYGSPIAISANSLKCNVEELQNSLQSYLIKNRPA